MEFNENNLSDTIFQEQELGSGEGIGNVSVDVLKTIEDATGRKYPTIEEAKKGIKETYDFVGKAGNYKKTVEAIAQKLDLGDEKGVLDWLNTSVEVKPDIKTSPVEEKVSDLEFVVANPELKEHLPTLKKLAKADGISLEEAKNSEFFQDYLKTKTSLKESQSRNSIIESNQRVGFQTDNVKPLVEQYQKTGSTDDAQKIVEEVLGLKKK